MLQTRRAVGRSPERPASTVLLLRPRALAALLLRGVAGPAFPDAGQREVGSKTRAGVEHRLTLGVAVVGQSDLVAEKIPGGRGTSSDQQAGVGEPVEELGLAGGAGDGLPDGFAEFFAGGALAALASGFVAFGAGGPLCGGAVAGGDLVEAEFLLDEAGFGLGAGAGAEVVWAVAVFGHEGGDDVDVVVRVPYRGPATAGLSAAGVDAGGGDDTAGDAGPFLVGQDPVPGVGAHGGVPDVFGGAGVLGECHDGLVEELLEVFEGGVRVAAGVGGHAVERGHEVWVGVLLGLAGAVEVGEESDGP